MIRTCCQLFYVDSLIYVASNYYLSVSRCGDVELSETQLREDGSNKFVEFTDTHRRIRRLKAALMHCVRRGCPLVIHGPPGSGRTSMTAAVSQFCRSWLSAPHAVVAGRVLASSPASMTIEPIISAICCQIAEVSTKETK